MGVQSGRRRARGSGLFAGAARQQPTPVVFVFHGHGGHALNVVRSFAMNRHWPEAISVYMQGLNTPGRLTDPQGKVPGWQMRLGDQHDRDLKFFDAVLGAAQARLQGGREARFRHRALQRRRLYLPVMGGAG